MGAPLLVIGASANRLLPHAGHWMERVKAVFGVLLLAVAIWMLERILPAALVMLLWAVLLIVSATFLGALQPVSHGRPAWRVAVRGFGVVMLVYGVLLLVGVAAGGRDPLQPLRGVGFTTSDTMARETDRFRPVKTVADLERELDSAHGRYVMLDFYADWCVTCKELEKYTFTAPEVRPVLADMVLLRADVTANDAADQALLRHFGIIGPPAILFFDATGKEHRPYRVVGFMSAGDFRGHLERVLNNARTAAI
jgi:thiol:disulfide interchange protein DsbD